MHSTFQRTGMHRLLSRWVLASRVILRAGQDEAHPHIEMLSRCTIPLNDSGNGFVILDYGRSIEAPNPTQRLFHVVIWLGQGNQSELVVFEPHHFQRSRNSTIVIEDDPAVVVSQLRFVFRLDYHTAVEVKNRARACQFSFQYLPSAKALDNFIGQNGQPIDRFDLKTIAASSHHLKYIGVRKSRPGNRFRAGEIATPPELPEKEQCSNRTLKRALP